MTIKKLLSETAQRTLSFWFLVKHEYLIVPFSNTHFFELSFLKQTKLAFLPQYWKAVLLQCSQPKIVLSSTQIMYFMVLLDALLKILSWIFANITLLSFDNTKISINFIRFTCLYFAVWSRCAEPWNLTVAWPWPLISPVSSWSWPSLVQPRLTQRPGHLPNMHTESS